MIMTFRPSVGFNPPGPTRNDGFPPEAIYELANRSGGCSEFFSV